MQILVGVVTLLAVVIIGLQVWRWSDNRADATVWRALQSARSGVTGYFDPSMVDDLPTAARQYFRYTIQPGARLRTVAEIDMHGEIGLGTKDNPNYLPMRARQILAAPHGFVWQVTAGSGALRVAGSDGAGPYPANSWSRFWLLGMVPVGRAGGGDDHARSAFGRFIAEAVFWTPAALLPQNGVIWTEVDEHTARAGVSFNGMTQTVDVTIAASGQPVKVAFPRWSDANPDKQFRVQPFGGYLHDFRQFDGYLLPTRIEAGNFFGTDEYFPFFRAVVDELRFVGSHRATPR